MIGKVDAVYILGEGSKYDNAEIVYSVRSLCKHVKNLRRMWIVGARPRHFDLRTYQFIPHGRPYVCKDAVIAGGMEKACLDRDVSDPFLCVHDDHFMLKDFDAAEFPAWHKMSGVMWRSSDKRYDKDLKACERILKHAGVKAPVSFETHTPILVHKREFLRALRRVDLRRDNFTVKSLYANLCDRLNKVQLDDYKVKGDKIEWNRMEGRPCFSVSNEIPACAWELLKKLYPTPSPFERGIR